MGVRVSFHTIVAVIATAWETEKMKRFIKNVVLHPLTFIIITIVVVILGIEKVMPYLINYPPPEVKVGVCVISKDLEFPKCQDIHRIDEIGDTKVLISSPHSSTPELQSEFHIRSVRKYYKEIPCDCNFKRK